MIKYFLTLFFAVILMSCSSNIEVIEIMSYL